MSLFETRNGGVFRILLPVLLGPLSACGPVDSLTLSWSFDGSGKDHSGKPVDPETPPDGDAGAPAACEHEPTAGFAYPGAGELWLGAQDELQVEVVGFGYLALEDREQLEIAYARAASLSVDSAGFVRDSAGRYALGLNSSEPEPCPMRLRLPNLQRPRATERVSLVANADARSTAPAVDWDPSRPEATSNWSAELPVFDSLGVMHRPRLFFRAWGFGDWEYYVLVDSSELARQPAGAPESQVQVAQGTLSFNLVGGLVDYQPRALTLDFAGGAAAQQRIELDFGDALVDDGAGFAGIVSLAAPSAVAAIEQDGFATGTVTGARVCEPGQLCTRFDNGSEVPLEPLALARFASEADLTPAADGTLRPSSASGEPQFGLVGTSGRGLVVEVPEGSPAAGQ